MSSASSGLKPAVKTSTGVQTGVLIINLGTPNGATTGEVRKFLREFLSDPNVIDINPVARRLLLYLYVLPFRPIRSARAYKKVWTRDGSPLLVHGRDLARELGSRLGKGIPVYLAMRYGNPSISTALKRLKEHGVDRIVILPLYPQFAASTITSTMDKVAQEARSLWADPSVVQIPPFYSHPGFIRSMAAIGKPLLGALDPDHILMSYHGLPERHIRKIDAKGMHCLANDSCCDRIQEVNRNCYRAHCFETSRLLARELGLAPGDYTVCFQSRMGRAPWIKPYTDRVVERLAKTGKKRVAVFCPAFVADCLETLEEIGIRGREQFVAAGGETLTLIPSLNTHPMWVETVTEMLQSCIREGART